MAESKILLDMFDFISEGIDSTEVELIAKLAFLVVGLTLETKSFQYILVCTYMGI